MSCPKHDPDNLAFERLREIQNGATAVPSPLSITGERHAEPVPIRQAVDEFLDVLADRMQRRRRT